MPELPEVEALRRYLVASGVPGRVIVRVENRWPGVLRPRDASGSLDGLAERRIHCVGRHGKQLWLSIDDAVLGLHMGMTGRLVVMGPDEEPLRFTHTTIWLDDGRRIELDDPRKWAAIRWARDPSELTAGLGPDALDSSFTADEFAERVRRRRVALKPVLMDQSVLAGVGNIYGDEALFRAGISPVRKANRTARERLQVLHGEVHAALIHALEYIVSHTDEHGRPFVVDSYDGRMLLSRKKGALCPNCGAALKGRLFGNRTAYHCPECQT